MYLPNKITNVLDKIDKPYEVKYMDGRIASVYIKEKNIIIEASSKGFCINLKGGPIFLNDLKNIEPLLIKMNVVENKKYKSKKENIKKDPLIELFSIQKDNFSVEYENFKVLSIKMETPSFTIRKTGVGFTMIVNNESISIDSIISLKKLLEKMNAIKTKTSKKSKDKTLFEQLTIDLDEYK